MAKPTKAKKNPTLPTKGRAAPKHPAPKRSKGKTYLT